VSKIGKTAGVRLLVDPKNPQRMKVASAHDLRRAFGGRWAARVMPAVLKELMRHKSIETTIRYHAGTNAKRRPTSAGKLSRLPEVPDPPLPW
jgi:integrase